MRELYEHLRDGGERAIEALRENRMEEDLQLEFKTKSSADRYGLSDDDKKSFGECLSGFSNSAGGLLIFGVLCRKGEDGVDCVQSLHPIIEIDRHASDLRSMLGGFLQPGNDGIEISVVQSEASPGSGYLLMLVPRSERRPHQSRVKGHFRYYKRIGRDFHPMEHYDVEDAFSRNSLADLHIELANHGYARSGVFEFRVGLNLRNDAIVTAKYPFVKIGNLSNISLMQVMKGHSGIEAVYANGSAAAVGGADQVVHSAIPLNMLTLRIFATQADGGWLIDGVPADEVQIGFDYAVGCENGLVKEGRFTQPARDFLIA